MWCRLQLFLCVFLQGWVRDDAKRLMCCLNPVMHCDEWCDCWGCVVWIARVAHHCGCRYSRTSPAFLATSTQWSIHSWKASLMLIAMSRSYWRWGGATHVNASVIRHVLHASISGLAPPPRSCFALHVHICVLKTDRVSRWLFAASWFSV